MNPLELRIGNLVTDEFYDTFSKIITVESVNDKGINLEVQNSDDYPELQKHWIDPYYKFDQLRGIPLTEEWLLKFGFVHINQNRYNHFEKNGVWIYLLYDKTFELELETLHERHNLCRQWEYVHQLQNLYWCLTGEELTASQSKQQ